MRHTRFWEVVLDAGPAECDDPVVQYWNGGVGIRMHPVGADGVAEVEIPYGARIVHVTCKIGTPPRHCGGLSVPDSVTLVDLSGLQLTWLGDSAFGQCRNLMCIEAPGGCSLGAVGGGFASDTPQLRYVDAEHIGATSIGDGFLGNSGVAPEDRPRLQSLMLQ